MRQFATGLNRTWLGIVGLVLLLAGVLALATGTGLLASVLGSGPTSDDVTLGSEVADLFANTAVVLGVALVGLVMALLGLGWLLAQVPRTNAAAPLRLRDDATTGVTICAPSVLTDAVSADAQTLPGVTGADAVLRGTAQHPELTLRVTTNDRTDIADLLRSLNQQVVANLEAAVGVPLARLAVQVDVSPERRTADSVTL